MKTFEQTAAQGDVMFRRVEAMPEHVKEVAPKDGKLVITHSESGHDHVMVLERETETPSVQLFADDDNPLVSWLQVNRPSVLEHMRPSDTHEPISFGPGTYEVRRQREHTPEGLRRVED